jgi:hypothetical protein
MLKTPEAKLVFNAGDEIIIVKKPLNPVELRADGIAHRNVSSFQLPFGTVYISEFSYVSLFQNNSLLRKLRKHKDQNDRLLTAKIEKLAGCLQITGAAKGPFSKNH